jgi:hypothetical protein
MNEPAAPGGANSAFVVIGWDFVVCFSDWLDFI